MSTVHDLRLSRAAALDYLERWADQECNSTLYLPPGNTLSSVQAHVRVATGANVPESLAEAAQSSPTGACLFSGSKVRLVVPPFPVKEWAVFNACERRPLLSMLREDKTIAVVLIRLGAYAVGVCMGENLVSSKVGTGLVHARHRQGGSSSQRFRRHREKQIEQFLSRVCERIGGHIGPHLREVDFIVYGGAWTTIGLLRRQCALLSALQDRELPSILDIGEPKQTVLEACARRVWSSRIIEWEDANDVN